MFPLRMKMLATRIKFNINARSLHTSAQNLIKNFPALYTNTPDFGYSNEKQKTWAKVYPGWSRQYPIVIYSGSVELMGMAPLQMEGYDKSVPGRLSMSNNGHTIAITYTQDHQNQCNNCRPPTISGGLLKSVYEFECLHFHWTKKNNRGCEHVINNKRYPLEMHLVHRNIKYDCIEKALEHEDGLCVAAVFFGISEMPYKPLYTFLDNFMFIQNANTNITLDCALVLDTLLPIDTQNFYTYKGSLLSPPYNKSINWIIFSQPIYISFDQMLEFHSLQKIQNNEIFDSCRNIQPIENKKIFVRDPNITFIPACNVPCPNIPITTNDDAPTKTYNDMYFPHLSNNGYKSNFTNKELYDPTTTKKEVHNPTGTYKRMYFPISPENEHNLNNNREADPTSTCDEEFVPSKEKKNESESSKKIEPNPTSINNKELDSTLTEEKNLQSTATSKVMDSISSKNESKLNNTATATNKNALDPSLTKEETHHSTDTIVISPKNEREPNKNIETNPTLDNKEALNPKLTKETTTTSNIMCLPVSPKYESESSKKIDSKTGSDAKALDPVLNKEKNCQSTASYNEMLPSIPTKNVMVKDSNKKIETKKETLESTLSKKDATTSKKEICSSISTNVISTKTEDRGFIATVRNMIKDALINFFSK